MSLQVKLLDSGTDFQNITVIDTATSGTVSASCSGGSVAVGSSSDRYNHGGLSVNNTLVTITGLSANTTYTYTVSKNTESVSGSFTTQTSGEHEFGWIMATCDSWRHKTGKNSYTAIRKLCETSPEKIAGIFMIDDLFYTDDFTLSTDSETGLSSGVPQSTGLGRDYAVSYAVLLGCTGYDTQKWRHADRLWVNRNIPTWASGGDHAIEFNHCRGPIGSGDYQGCDRTVGGLEEIGKAEWDSAIGNGNPTPLRTDRWHWGKTIGDVSFSLWDYSLYSQPHNPASPDADLVAYGSEQINDIMSYHTTQSSPFNIFLMESGINVGQPWHSSSAADPWHPNEANGWKTTFDAENKLNGVSGSSVVMYGDNHSPHVMSFDTFWGFCAGVLQDAASVNFGSDTEGSIGNFDNVWSGKQLWRQKAYSSTGDHNIGCFLWCRRLGSVAGGTARLEAVFVDGDLKPDGSLRYLSPIFILNYQSTNNQWVRQDRLVS